MKIEDLISPGRSSVGLRVADKESLIRELAAQAAASLQLPFEYIADELLRREALGSTGIGDGVAMPHARLAELKTAFGSIVRLKKPIEFEAVDDKPVDIAVLVLLPASPAGDQLNALACVARALRQPGRLDLLRKAKNDEELYRELVRQ